MHETGRQIGGVKLKMSNGRMENLIKFYHFWHPEISIITYNYYLWYLVETNVAKEMIFLIERDMFNQN